MSGEIFEKAKKNKTEHVGPGKYLTTEKGSSDNTAWLKQSIHPLHQTSYKNLDPKITFTTEAIVIAATIPGVGKYDQWNYDNFQKSKGPNSGVKIYPSAKPRFPVTVRN